eukprot:scaffold26300_cov130-Isochrysis_galbana.AAC.1
MDQGDDGESCAAPRRSYRDALCVARSAATVIIRTFTDIRTARTLNPHQSLPDLSSPPPSGVFTRSDALPAFPPRSLHKGI